MIVRELFDTRNAKLFAAMLAAVAMMVLTPGIAHAYEIELSITGAGTVDEDPGLTQADMLKPACSSPQTTPTGVVGANCYPGDPGGDYGWGWTVRWKATPMPGWSFVRWQSDGRTTPPYRLCDGQNGPTYTIDECQFGTYANYQMRAVFADTTAPTASITGGPAANSTSGRDVTFTFAVTDQPSGQPVSYRCKLTGPTAVVQDWTSCASSKSYSGLSNGGHTFEVEAKDPSSNATTASRAWSVDAVQPETTLTTDGPAEGSTVASNSATFQWTGSPDTQKYFCQVDSGPVIDPCTSPRSTGTLADGPHTFKVWAQDTNGNVETSPATRSWTIDTVPPSGAVSINGGATYTRSTAVNLTLSSSDAASMRFSNDTINWSDWETYATSRPWFLTSVDGTKTVYTQYKDGAGNLSSASVIRDEIQLDTTLPDTALDASGPSGTVKSTSASFSFSSEAGAIFECKLDGGTFEACTSPKSYSALKNGKHTFSVRAKDAAGNVDATPAVRIWTVDTIKPTVSGMTPRHASITRDTTPTIKATVKDNLTNLKKGNIRLFVAGKAIPAKKFKYSAATDKLVYNSPKLAKGKKTVRIVATDAAKNVGAKSWFFTIK